MLNKAAKFASLRLSLKSKRRSFCDRPALLKDTDDTECHSSEIHKEYTARVMPDALRLELEKRLMASQKEVHAFGSAHGMPGVRSDCVLQLVD